MSWGRTDTGARPMAMMRQAPDQVRKDRLTEMIERICPDQIRTVANQGLNPTWETMTSLDGWSLLSKDMTAEVIEFYKKTWEKRYSEFVDDITSRGWTGHFYDESHHRLVRFTKDHPCGAKKDQKAWIVLAHGDLEYTKGFETKVVNKRYDVEMRKQYNGQTWKHQGITEDCLEAVEV